MMTSLTTSMPPPAETTRVFALIALIADPVATQQHLDALARSTQEHRIALQVLQEEADNEQLAARQAALEICAAQATVVEERNAAERARLEEMQAEYDDRVRRLKELAAA
jgi:hypothetical protein